MSDRWPARLITLSGGVVAEAGLGVVESSAVYEESRKLVMYCLRSCRSSVLSALSDGMFICGLLAMA